MNRIYKSNKYVRMVRNVVIFILISFLGFIITSEDLTSYLSLKGLPIQNIEKLFVIHIIANAGLFLGTGFLAYLFFRLYYKLRGRDIPFVGFIWMFGGFKACMSVIFFMNLLNMWRAYYWIDGTIRIFAAVFAVGAALAFYNSFSQIVNIKSPDEYGELRDEIKRVLDIQQRVLETKPDKNA